MVNDAEKFADEDKKVKERVDARHELEGYLYGLKNQISDKEKLGAKLSEDDLETIKKAVEEKIEWLEANQSAEAEEYKAQKKAVEDVTGPIISKLYKDSGAGGAGGGAGGADEEDHDEL